MAIILSGTTNDITVNGVSVATDAEVSSAVASAVQTGLVALQTIATGTATFTATTNNINLTGIGVGVEIGDVIQITGADDAKNNSEFTVEVITDANNIIVNQAHANKGTSKNIAARASDAGVTVKLLAKWHNASNGLGQGWVNVTPNRALNVTYPNATNRSIIIALTSTLGTANVTITTSGLSVYEWGTAGGININVSTGDVTIPKGESYLVAISNAGIKSFMERR